MLKYCIFLLFIEFAYDCVDNWYKEIQKINFDNAQWSSEVDNKNTTKLGAGIEFQYTKMYCVTRYAPPAEKLNFKGNVLPPLKKSLIY